MFRKLLIANRGEVALRIARTARERGIDTVMVFSQDDFGSAHASYGTGSHALAARGPQAYLDIAAPWKRRGEMAAMRCIRATDSSAKIRRWPALASRRKWPSSARRPRSSNCLATRPALSHLPGNPAFR